MCGEHDCGLQSRWRCMGSSPHVRGARHGQGRDHGRRGIIPACAGSTSPATPMMPSRRDHPRMCGEHSLSMTSPLISTGSSPHVRGALGSSEPSGLPPGIIPACAGSTQSSSADPAGWRDHPRMCGEHVSDIMLPPSKVGSSPHVRGAQEQRVVLDQAHGIIPACAGSTSLTPSCSGS